ncbi:Bax inhibitor-1/YccA family protein [Porphyromonas catoniae]|jgi:membrane protein|uniref:Bax inhibitor-1/YccA family protein n=1 Tax=Porphyromonas catoniae TaxID=41976 RepID=UPI0028D676EF|nr:Bax inhibitor-1/YccA family protein [Porphyromonas catoniae]
MENSQMPYEGQPTEGYYELGGDVVAQRAVQRTFLWMTLGLAITGLASVFTVDSGLVFRMLEGNMYWFLFIAEIALVWFLSARVMSLSLPVATGAFALYSILNGVTLSPIFLIYTSESIASTFFITAGTFGAMALYGYMTKRDLTRLGSLLFMALIGVIIATVVNIFLRSEILMWIITYAGIVLFVGLTAYDTQKVKQLAAQTAHDEELSKKVSIIGALNLYLDFINLFLYLLRLFGRRN